MMGSPGHSTVVAYLALFVALGGSAYAALDRDERKPKPAQLRAGVGDETAVPADVVLNFPKHGFKVETDGLNGANDDVLIFRNTRDEGQINFVSSDDASEYTVGPGGSVPFEPSNRVVDFMVIRDSDENPKKAVHLNCGFPFGEKTFCVALDVKPE